MIVSVKFFVCLVIAIIVTSGCGPTKPDAGADEYGCYANSEAYATEYTRAAHNAFTEASYLNPAFFGVFMGLNVLFASSTHSNAYNCCLAYNKNIMLRLPHDFLDTNIVDAFRINKVEDNKVYCSLGQSPIGSMDIGSIRWGNVEMVIPLQYMGWRGNMLLK